MRENQLSRYGAYGRTIVSGNGSQANQPLAPNAKYFFVGAVTLPSYADFQAEFGMDQDGQNRTFATVASCIADGNVVAARGDIIYVLPGHTENLTSAGSTALSKSGISLIGLGNGNLRPIFTATAVAGSMTVTAANVLIQNVVFTFSIDAVTNLLNITGTDCRVDECDFRLSSATLCVVTGITTAATADRLRIQNCRFLGVTTSSSGTTTTAAIKHEAGTDYVIEHNFIYGKMTQGIVNVATVLGGFINNNVISVQTGTSAITMAAASTPLITNNRMNVASGTAPVTAAAGFVAGNTYSAAPGVTAGVAVTF